MLTVVVSFLKTHWQTTLIASAIVAVLGTISVQHLEIDHLSSKLALCHAEGVTLEDSNKALVASIENQNRAIETLEARGRLKQAHVAKAIQSARDQAAIRNDTAKRIMAQPSSGNECNDMKKLVNDFVVTQK